MPTAWKRPKHLLRQQRHATRKRRAKRLRPCNAGNRSLPRAFRPAKLLKRTSAFQPKRKQSLRREQLGWRIAFRKIRETPAPKPRGWPWPDPPGADGMQANRRVAHGQSESQLDLPPEFWLRLIYVIAFCLINLLHWLRH